MGRFHVGLLRNAPSLPHILVERCSAMSGFGRTADVSELVLRSSPSNCALHKGGCFIPLLLSFQLSFLLWTTLSLFLLFLSTFISASLITHIGFSVTENTFSALRFSSLGRVLRGPFRAKSRQRRYVAECLPWVAISIGRRNTLIKTQKMASMLVNQRRNRGFAAAEKVE